MKTGATGTANNGTLCPNEERRPRMDRSVADISLKALSDQVPSRITSLRLEKLERPRAMVWSLMLELSGRLSACTTSV